MSDSVAQLERLAKQHGVTVTVRANGHVQARGSILVNWYPNSRKAVMYVAGTVKGVEHATPMQVIDAAIGKSLPPMRKTHRRKDYSRYKRKLWRGNRHLANNCHWCKQSMTFGEATIDHVIPLSLGGINHLNNYVLSCHPCNNARGNSIPRMA